MQSEEEKYYLIDQYLKGKLSENEETVLKGSFSADEFRKETDMHRLANEAVEENYLLGIRAATQKVIKRNSAWQKGKWAAGTCIIAAGIIAYTIYTGNEIKQEPTPFTKQVPEKSIVIQQNEPAKPTLKPRNTIKPNEISQTTNIRKAAVREEQPEYIVLPKPSLEELSKPEVFKESEPTEKPVMVNNIVAPAIIQKEEKKQLKELPISVKTETTELILSPDRNEIIYFPVDEGFDGELVVLDVTGNTVFKQQIHNGLPKEWNGTTETGSAAVPGQYVFLIKSREGKEIKQGYITVVR